MRLAHPLIRLEAKTMPIQSLVAIAQRRDHRRDSRQLIEHAIHIDVARMHHEIDSREDLENPFREMLAGFGNMSVRDKTDSHHDMPGRFSPPSTNRELYHGPETLAIFKIS